MSFSLGIIAVQGAVALDNSAPEPSASYSHTIDDNLTVSLNSIPVRFSNESTTYILETAHIEDIMFEVLDIEIDQINQTENVVPSTIYDTPSVTDVVIQFLVDPIPQIFGTENVVPATLFDPPAIVDTLTVFDIHAALEIILAESITPLAIATSVSDTVISTTLT